MSEPDFETLGKYTACDVGSKLPNPFNLDSDPNGSMQVADALLKLEVPGAGYLADIGLI
jgi:hypothetical protein